MKRHVLGLLSLVVFLFALAMVVGCTPAAAPTLPAYCYDGESFTGAVTDCARKAPSLEASRACRAEVHKACGITMTERSAAP